MMRRIVLALALLTVASGCKDLSRNRIVPTASASASSSAPRASASSDWRPALCAEDSAPSSPSDPSHMSFTGQCTLRISGLASCRAYDDDFYVLVTQPMKSGALFNFYVNVERFKGRGHYPGQAQVHVGVRQGPTLYRWSNLHGTMKVEADAAPKGAKKRGEAMPTVDGAATLESVVLEAEPGTGATGTIVVEGDIRCAHGDAGTEMSEKLGDEQR
jgi:hypothetical protein